MRTPQVSPTQAAPGASKEKKQVVALVGLLAVLAVVLVSQLGGGGEAAASAATAAPGAAAPEAAPAPTPPAESSPTATRPALVSEVLSRPAEAVSDSVFESFWDAAAPVEAQVEELPPPPIMVNATIVAASGSLAVIDGTLRREGDVIGGWSLDAIRMREVSLRSPSDRIVTVAMPLLAPPVLYDLAEPGAAPPAGPHDRPSDA